MVTRKFVTNTASDRQIALVNSLIKSRDVPDVVLESFRTLWRLGEFTKETASLLIQKLYEIPENEKLSKASENSLVGFHNLSGVLAEYRVAKKTGMPYAYIYPNGVKKYAPNAVILMTADTKLSDLEAEIALANLS